MTPMSDHFDEYVKEKYAEPGIHHYEKTQSSVQQVHPSDYDHKIEEKQTQTCISF